MADISIKTFLQKIAILRKKTETRTLLWTNPSPSAGFASQDISLPNVYSNYDFLEIEYKVTASDDTATGAKVMNRAPCHNYTTAVAMQWNSSSNVWALVHRAWWWKPNDCFHFDASYWNVLNSYASAGQDDSNMVPYKIYGIKLGGVVRNIKNAVTTGKVVMAWC